MEENLSTNKIIGWLSAIIIPAILYFLCLKFKFSWSFVNFTVVFVCALMMWIFRLVPEYVPAIFVILASMILGLVPKQIILSGYTSGSFFMALSIFGLGAVIVSSGIFYRISLIFLKHLPKRLFFIQFAIFIIGALLSTVMTAQSSRISMMVPLIKDMAKAAGFSKKSVAINSIAMAGFGGSIYLSVIFLTGKSSNFILYGMLPQATQFVFSWLFWFFASILVLIILVVGFFILLRLFFKTHEQPIICTNTINQQLRDLGPLNIHEWASILGVVLLAIGIMLTSFHHIQPPWIAFAVLYILLAMKILDNSQFKKNINWAFLFYLGGIIGIMRGMHYVGIDTWILHYLGSIGRLALISDYLFIIVIYFIGIAGSFLFGTAAAPALLFAILSPIASHVDFSLWVLAFVILTATESWFLPYQSSYYLCFEELVNADDLVDTKKMLLLNACFIGFRLLALLLTIPFWHYLRII